MKAVWYNAFGKAADVLQVGDMEKPLPGHGQVLVHMKTSGINPSDTKKRAGAFPEILDNGPVVPNSDGAGIIEAVGAGVSKARIGQRVWVYQAQFGRSLGTAAEYLAIESKRAVTLPDNTDFHVGACLGIPAMTAHRCVFADGSVRDKIVLVTGGAGKVGYYAVQWAKRDGAFVIATAGSDEDISDCYAAGADAVVGFRGPEWDQQVLSATKGCKVDRVIDVEFGTNLPHVLNLIKTGGTIASYSSMVVPKPCLPFKEMMFMDLTLRLVIVYSMPEEAKEKAIHDITHSLTQRELLHRYKTLPLEEIVKASEQIESGGTRGCITLGI